MYYSCLQYGSGIKLSLLKHESENIRRIFLNISFLNESIRGESQAKSCISLFPWLDKKLNSLLYNKSCTKQYPVIKAPNTVLRPSRRQTGLRKNRSHGEAAVKRRVQRGGPDDNPLASGRWLRKPSSSASRSLRSEKWTEMSTQTHTHMHNNT